jgi:restriction endonuclease S subunit
MTFWPSSIRAKLRPLKHLARFNPEVLSEGTDPDFEFEYIDIGGVTLEQGVRHTEAMRFEAAPSRARKPVRTGDVIVSTVRTYLKAVARIDATHNGAVVSTGFAVLRPNADVDAGYLYRLCQANPFVGDVQAQSTGVSYPAINPSALAAIKVPLPDLNTQKAIAAYLDRETARIDQLIAKRSRFVELLREMRVAVVSRAVTRGINTNAEFKASGVDWLGAIPAHWQVVPPTALFTESKERARDGDQLLSATQKYGVIPLAEYEELEQRQVTLAVTNLEMRKHVEVGDFVISMRSMDGGLERAHATGCVRSSYSVLKVGPSVEGRFYGYLLKSSLYIQALRQTANFIRDGQDMNFGHFRKVRLPRLELDEQRAIADHIDAKTTRIDALVAKTERSIDLLREHRAALITAAVTGPGDIREKLPAVATEPNRATWRVIVGAEIVHRLPDNPKRARVKVHKLTYLAEAHLRIDGLQGNYLREAAGPLDRVLREETERGLEAAGYFRANQPDGTGTAVTYTPLAKAGQHKAELDALLGPKTDDLRSLIVMLADLDRRQTEAVATLYAVWNDALMDGQMPDDATIINGVLNNWHTEKGDKFTTADLTHWLAWMKRHNLIPRGQGPRTIPTQPKGLFA